MNWSKSNVDFSNLSPLTHPTSVGQLSNTIQDKLVSFLIDISENWDCDQNSNNHHAVCRKCEAKNLLLEIEGG